LNTTPRGRKREKFRACQSIKTKPPEQYIIPAACETAI